MTITDIVQNLLEKGHITAKEALILLKAEIYTSPQLINNLRECIKLYHIGSIPPQISPHSIWFTNNSTTEPFYESLNYIFTSK